MQGETRKNSGASRSTRHRRGTGARPLWPRLLTQAMAVSSVMAVAVIGVAPATATPAAEPTPATATEGSAQIQRLLDALPVRAESNRGYSRERFDDWQTQANGCDTRQLLLIAEARGGTRRGCDMRGARWFSYLDGVTTRNPSTFDIDHTVALAEAWGSGAKGWTRARRDAFANDLGYRDSLIATSASSNRSKADSPPTTWTAPRRAGQCRLVQAWIAVKWRWGLSVDSREMAGLERQLATCPEQVVPLPTRTR